MNDDRWQSCRERFTAQCKAVKELAGGAPRDSRNESLKGESHSREVASGEGTISSQPMSDHAAVTQNLTGFHPGDKVLYRGEVRVVTRPFDGTLPFLTLEKNGANEAVDVLEVKPVDEGGLK